MTDSERVSSRTERDRGESARRDGESGRDPSREDEPATLARTTVVVQDVGRALLRASTRTEIETAVTDRLAAADAYALAWVGDRRRSSDVVAPRAVAGDDRGYLDAVTVTADPDADDREPVGRALATGRTAVVRRLDDRGDESWRAASLARGYRAVAGVPLAYGERPYGVLGLCARRADAFGGAERAVIAQLGETVGHAIDAVENRTLLLSDGAVELEFRVTNANSFFLAASADLDCRFEVQGIVPTSDDGLLYYERLTGADPGTVLDRAVASPSIEDARLVTDGDEGALLTFTVTRSSPTMTLTDHGAQVRSAVADRGVGRIVAVVGAGTDVRRLVERVREAFPSVELLSKREVVRDAASVPAPGRRTLVGRLTERQRAALDAAFHAGYFEWPRESTAEEVADAVGVSSPTLHYHLRNAQRAILSALLDEGVGGPPGGA